MRTTRIFTSVSLVIAAIELAAATDSSAKGENPTHLVSDTPAAPPESAEARIALRQHRESTALNRFTFKGNVLEGTGDIVEHWIVMFCSGWHEKCQGLLPSYELLGVQWENKLNKAVMSTSVRFAKVDCATEKALCVSLDIDDYPSVVHYHNQQRIASWHGGAPGLVRFVKQELEGKKKRPSRASTPAQSRKSSVCEEASQPLVSATTGEQWGPFLRAVCLSLLVVAAARSVWVLLSARVSRNMKSLQTGPTMSQQLYRAPSTSVTACLPEEWARERATIVL